MKRIQKMLWCALILAAGFGLASCNLYDDMSKMPQTGGGDGRFSYVDATSYTQWVYLNLEDGSCVALAYNDSTDIPEEWTFALHRYDCKTNAGAAMETAFGSLEEMEEAMRQGTFSPENGQYVQDSPDSIYIDLSQMLDSVLVYAPSMVNKELSKWLDVDISGMPPIYTPSHKVYVIRTKEDEYVAVLFTSFSNPYYYDAKGYISFSYIYPLDRISARVKGKQ